MKHDGLPDWAVTVEAALRGARIDIFDAPLVRFCQDGHIVVLAVLSLGAILLAVAILLRRSGVGDHRLRLRKVSNWMLALGGSALFFGVWPLMWTLNPRCGG
jgi:hypothetical protein